VPGSDGAGYCEGGHDEGLEHREELRDNEDLFSVEFISDDAAEWGSDEDGGLEGEADNAEIEDRVRELVDQPAHSDALHPGADKGDALACEEEAVVSVSQSPQEEPEAVIVLIIGGVVHFSKPLYFAI
jgi:hypothetical protein